MAACGAARPLRFLCASCASTPAARLPRDQFPLDPRRGAVGAVSRGHPGRMGGALRRGRCAGRGSSSRRREARQPGLASQIGLIEVLVAGGIPSRGPRRLRAGSRRGRSDGPAARGLRRGARALGTGARGPRSSTGGPWPTRAGGRGSKRGAAELRARRRAAAARRRRRRQGRRTGRPPARRSRGRSSSIRSRRRRARRPATSSARPARRPAALARYREALDRAAERPTLLEEDRARSPSTLSDYGAAVPVLDKLAAQDPTYEAQAGRRAPRLSRRQLAGRPAGGGALAAPDARRGGAARLVDGAGGARGERDRGDHRERRRRAAATRPRSRGPSRSGFSTWTARRTARAPTRP